MGFHSLYWLDHLPCVSLNFSEARWIIGFANLAELSRLCTVFNTQRGHFVDPRRRDFVPSARINCSIEIQSCRGTPSSTPGQNGLTIQQFQRQKVGSSSDNLAKVVHKKCILQRSREDRREIIHRRVQCRERDVGQLLKAVRRLLALAAVEIVQTLTSEVRSIRDAGAAIEARITFTDIDLGLTLSSLITRTTDAEVIWKDGEKEITKE